MSNIIFPEGHATPKYICLSDIISEYRLGIACVELIYLIGAKKYPLFSWYRTPASSDSTPRNCINAMFRHFSEIYPDPLSRDPESGMYHFMHLACRCAMLVGVLDKINVKSVAQIEGSIEHGCHFGTLLIPSVLRSVGVFDNTFRKHIVRDNTNFAQMLFYLKNTIITLAKLYATVPDTEFDSEEARVTYNRYASLPICTFGTILLELMDLFKTNPVMFDTLEKTIGNNYDEVIQDYYRQNIAIYKPKA